MVDMFVDGLNNKVLKCPRCSAENLHQVDVDVFARAGEDEAGIKVTTTSEMAVSVRPMTARAMPMRRDSVVIWFKCECCHFSQSDVAPVPLFGLEILQHKGWTVFSWLNE